MAVVIDKLSVGQSTVVVGSSTQVECETDTPHAMVEWTLVGLDDSVPKLEIAAHGTLAFSQTKADIEGDAFNYYLAPTTSAPANFGDRIKAEVSNA